MADKYVNGYKAIISKEARAILGGGEVPALVTANVTPTTEAQTITPDSGKAFNKIEVSAVTATIDNDIQPENIKKDVEILGVTGTLE